MIQILNPWYYFCYGMKGLDREQQQRLILSCDLTAF